MNEITKVGLENEMDLILAHKQSMRFAELTGLSLAAQTTLATAVSEVCRSCIGQGNESTLTLYISDKKEKIKYIIAVLEDSRKNFSEAKDEGYNYAKRLVQHINVAHTNTGVRIELHYRLPSPFRIDDNLLEKWRINLNTDPALSPYEEIKRKNRQLIEMADKVRESELQYKSLTDSLPIMIFSLTGECAITFANQWLYDYSGHTLEQINETQWEDILHPDDFTGARMELKAKIQAGQPVISAELRFKNVSTGEYRWHTGIFIGMPAADGSIGRWNTFMVDIHAQKLIEQTLKDNIELKEIKRKLEEKITQLDQSNQQLAQFAYITSHDLQEPLRKIGFYSDFLKKKFGHSFPTDALPYFDNLINATERMKVLIQDVLAYSTVGKGELTSVDLNEVMTETLHDLEVAVNEKKAIVTVGRLPVIEGNERQLKQLFENLISNALKFSKPIVTPQIDVAGEIKENKIIIYFKDNGIGFEELYMDKMFDLFQKLHTREKYKGTGIGLAICKKIVELHGGTISANGIPNEGSVFQVTLPLKTNNTPLFES